MKKFITLLVVICIVLTEALPAFSASAQTPRVEISFRVGDSTLKINGVEVQVETPYVVGEGVTLVPLRVITEAFGATVGWDADTQTVTLDYPGVNILLQIGNPIAEVNGKTETLLAAPELPNSSTMVPLRFISENFGATVSYDDATAAILVVKEAGAQNGSSLVGAVDTKYIGDSYYGWSMENPLHLEMTERRFDGLYTQFESGENAILTLSISFLKDSYDLTLDFNKAKASLSDYTLVKADKFPETNSMHLQGRNTQYFIDMYSVAKDGYYFSLIAVIANDDTELRDETIRILSTFKPEYTTEETHDLSNINGEWRTFESTNYNISMQVPADYVLYDDDKAKENVFLFVRPDTENAISGLSLAVYSKSSVGSAQTLAYKDKDIHQKTINDSLAVFSAMLNGAYGELSTYEYFISINGSYKNDCFFKSYYWELGEYVYNLTVELKTPFDGDVYAYADSLMQSVKAEPIDADKVGILERDDPDTSGVFTSTPKKEQWALTVPNSYTAMDIPGEDGANFEHKLTNAALIYSIQTSEYGFVGSVAWALSLSAENMISKYDAQIVQKPTKRTIGSKAYTCDILTYVEDGVKIYVHRYVTDIGSKQMHQFSFYTTELYHSQTMIREVEDIIASLKIK